MDKEAPRAGTTAGKGSRWPVIQVGLGPQRWREPRLQGRGRALPLSGHGPLTPTFRKVYVGNEQMDYNKMRSYLNLIISGCSLGKFEYERL